MTNTEKCQIFGRKDLPKARRIVIKAGTSIVSTPEGYPSLTRMAAIVEAVARLVKEGKEVIVVTSGAVGVGKMKLRKQQSQLGAVDASMLRPESYHSACAAAGQLGLMSLYETMFSQQDVATSQILLTAFDFDTPQRCSNVQHVMKQLLMLGVVPLLNENDAVSPNEGYELYGSVFSDNDSLAALVANVMEAEVLLLLTDVAGVYDRPPSHPNAKTISVYSHKVRFEVGAKSLQGRGGMGAKVDAALKAIDGKVCAVVIADGKNPSTIEKVLSGKQCGTLFIKTEGEEEEHTCIEPEEDENSDTEESKIAREAALLQSQTRTLAEQARAGCRQLQALTSSEQSAILLKLADKLHESRDAIMAANLVDLENATNDKLAAPLLMRLKLTDQKIDSLVAGIRSIAQQEAPVGKLISRTCIANDLVLDRVSCAIGVLLIIFESRPDCLPQIAACAIRSGNGLLLKGGKEAENSNAVLHKLVGDSIEEATSGKVSRNVVGIVTSRAEIEPLLKLDDVIDLVIPRGSASLVRHIKNATRIPVMGHAEGICHVYVDAAADLQKAINVVVDSKIDYPAACNAAETILFHVDTVQSGICQAVLEALTKAGVAILGGEKAVSMGLTKFKVEDFSIEFGDLTVNIEIVESVEAAISHIHTFGSAHTDTVITENASIAEMFLEQVDSACVFHNASTRFADGYRFGLGAEVGISTSRLNPRGPVGVEGLLSSKWQLRSTHRNGSTASSFAKGGEEVYKFEKLV